MLLEKYPLGNLTLKNRMVMAPLTRCRAIGNIPNEMMALYYEQRAGFGLIISEGVAPSRDGCGYARMPGAWSKEQTKGWTEVGEKVKGKNGNIFMQLMHSGRVSHPLNMEKDARVVAPSAIQLDGEMWTDSEGMQPYPVPEELTDADIQVVQQEYVIAAQNAIAAGFDGVELHGANGYLINQFISPITNKREGEYGGTLEKRCKFALELTQKVCDAIGKERVAMRISPYGVFSGMKPFEGIDETYLYLADKLSEIGIAYLHLVDHSSMGTPEVPNSIKSGLRNTFKGAFILSGGYSQERAETELKEKKGDLVAFGRLAISNPDLPERFKQHAEIVEPNPEFFYTAGAEGYTDYGFLNE